MSRSVAQARHETVAAIDRVVDPCSSAMGLPLGLAEMGLATVEAIDPQTGRVDVRLRLTSPCCAYGPTMARAIERELTALTWVRDAVVDIDHEAVWTESLVTVDAAARLASRREMTRVLARVRPYAWTHQQEDSNDG